MTNEAKCPECGARAITVVQGGFVTEAYCEADCGWCECGAVYVARLRRQLAAEREAREKAERELAACLEGQESLKRQTMRIRRALSPKPRDGVDTEDIAKEVVARLTRYRDATDGLPELLEEASRMIATAYQYPDDCEIIVQYRTAAVRVREART